MDYTSSMKINIDSTECQRILADTAGRKAHLAHLAKVNADRKARNAAVAENCRKLYSK